MIVDCFTYRMEKMARIQTARKWNRVAPWNVKPEDSEIVPRDDADENRGIQNCYDDGWSIRHTGNLLSEHTIHLYPFLKRMPTQSPATEDTRSWFFDVMNLCSNGKDRQISYLESIFVEFEIHSFLQISMEQIHSFLCDVQRHYQNSASEYTTIQRPYHTFLHAIDATHAVSVLCRLVASSKCLNPKKMQPLLLASVCHDLCHTGLSNDYYVRSNHAWSIEYKQPILQQMSIAASWKLMEKHKLLNNLSDMARSEFSCVFHESILASDMSMHKQLLSNLQAMKLRFPKSSASNFTGFPATGPPTSMATPMFDFHEACKAFDRGDGTTRSVPESNDVEILLCSYIMHLGETNAYTKSWEQCQFWASLLRWEFLEQQQHEYESSSERALSSTFQIRVQQGSATHMDNILPCGSSDPCACFSKFHVLHPYTSSNDWLSLQIQVLQTYIIPQWVIFTDLFPQLWPIQLQIHENQSKWMQCLQTAMHEPQMQWVQRALYSAYVQHRREQVEVAMKKLALRKNEGRKSKDHCDLNDNVDNVDKRTKSLGSCAHFMNNYWQSLTLEQLQDRAIYRFSLNIANLFVLFGRDVQFLCLPISWDVFFLGLTWSVVALLSTEMILQMAYQPKYRGSFYFLLDGCSITSIFLDVLLLHDASRSTTWWTTIIFIFKLSRSIHVLNYVQWLVEGIASIGAFLVGKVQVSRRAIRRGQGRYSTSHRFASVFQNKGEHPSSSASVSSSVKATSSMAISSKSPSSSRFASSEIVRILAMPQPKLKNGPAVLPADATWITRKYLYHFLKKGLNGFIPCERFVDYVAQRLCGSSTSKRCPHFAMSLKEFSERLDKLQMQIQVQSDDLVTLLAADTPLENGMESTSVPMKTLEGTNTSSTKSKSTRRNILEPYKTKIKSHVGQQLAFKTLQRILVFMFALLLVVLQSHGVQDDAMVVEQYGLTQLHQMAWHWTPENVKNDSRMQYEIARFLNVTQPVYCDLLGWDPAIVSQLAYYPMHESQTDVYQTFRSTDLLLIEVEGCLLQNASSKTCRSSALFNRSAYQLHQAMYNLCRTLFLVMCLYLSIVILTNDARRVVITPLERMISMVEKLAKNPLSSLHDSDQVLGKSVGSKQTYEIKLLEATLTKIAKLVQIGYGEAGASIISKNISGKQFNPMVPGEKIYAIFGFCDIRRFTDATECLKEQVMLFTNTIAGIVHGCVKDFHGAANRNVGDAFLLVWKIPSHETSLYLSRAKQSQCPRHLTAQEQRQQQLSDYLEDEINKLAPLHIPDGMSTNAFISTTTTATTSTTTTANTATANTATATANTANTTTFVPASMLGSTKEDGVVSTLKRKISVLHRGTSIADYALFAFLKTQIEIRRTKELQAYTSNWQIKKRFHDQFQVQLGLGLHVGWAIEGAVGSQYKIDATYLSSDVEMATTLECMTKSYGVPLLMSHWFYELLSGQSQSYCRAIDCVSLRDYNSSSSSTNGGAEMECPMLLYTCDITNTNMKSFHGARDLPSIQWGIEEKFHVTFKEGIDAYLRGNWGEARIHLELVLEKLKPDDGPSKTVLKIMEASQYEAPVAWPGYHIY